jgi:glycosyltransferase involved in cell wall biosynthesis
LNVSPPAVSIVIIARNEERIIGKCVSSLLEQDYPAFEVIFVDSNSSDHTMEIVQYLSTARRPIILLRDRGESAASARNKGLTVAHGELVAFVDGDCFFDRDWLKKSVDYLRDGKDANVAGVGGPYIQVPNAQSPVSRVISSVESTRLAGASSAEKRIPTRPKHVNALSLCGAVFWADVLARVGPFNSILQYCEDSEFCYRVRSLGFKLLWATDIGVYHVPKYSSIRSYAKKMWNYGVGRGQAIRLNKRLFTWVGLGSLGCSALFVSLCFAGFAFGFPQQRLMAILMVMLYLATVSAFSVKVAIKIGSMQAFFLAAASYLALHMPYIGGLVVGMLIPSNRASSEARRFP